MTALRAIVVDDEPLTRERVAALIHESPDVEFVGEATNGLEALDLITLQAPDVIFLDVEMPELDGFGVIAAMDVTRMPAIIMVTAFERYAVRAFDVGAIDYLHKPITATRFAAAVTRAHDRFNRRTVAEWEATVNTAVDITRSRGYRTRFVVRYGSTHQLVPVSAVEWIDVADNYLQLHVTGRAHLVRGTMKDAECELDPARFVRVHRSAMVAIDRIASIRLIETGGHMVVLQSGARVRSSRQYANRLRSIR